MVAKKDFNAPKHPALEKIPNLHVIKAMQSLKSRGYVKEQFAWRHYYWYVTNEGIQYLRDYLHLPPEIVPTTLKRQAKPQDGVRSSRGGPQAAGGENQPKQEQGAEAYRREGGGGRPAYGAGFGRGKGAPPPQQ